MKEILFICTHNSARSQIAEGLVNQFWNNNWKAYSAGTIKTKIKPEAIQVMAEIGIDISHHSSKTLQEFAKKQFAVVVTVCDSAREACPYFPGKKIIHKSFPDPSNVKDNQERRLAAFRETRDLFKGWLEKLFVELS